MAADPKLEATIAELCPSCGMCCNGVLFADVRLRAADDLKKLAALGLRLERHGNKMRFMQPCPAFDGKLCRVYAQRPSPCQAFECRLLTDIHDGRKTVPEAHKVIRQIRKLAEKVLLLLEALGNSDRFESLSSRYKTVMAQPWDLSEAEILMEARNELPGAMERLMQLAQTEFLT
jgi:Fe-S-cluster containining protein